MNPNSPKMMDGIPARQSAPKRMTRVRRFSQVYSVKKMAVPTPSGTATIRAIAVRASVPMIVEKIPPVLPIP